MASQFSDVVIAHLRKQRLDDAAISNYLNTYLLNAEQIPDLPPPETLSIEDITAYSERNTYKSGGWAEFKKVALDQYQSDNDANDVFQPIWDGKSEERQMVWLTDTVAPGGTGGLANMVSKNMREGLAALLRKSSPGVHLPTTKRLVAPTSHKVSMNQIQSSVFALLRLFSWELGAGDNSTWRWGPTLTMFGGLGLDFVRAAARELKVNDGWDHLPDLPDDELIGEIIAARNTCGYPLGLLRCDFKALNRILENETVVPRWYEAVLALHIIKYCRFIHRYGGDPDTNALIIAYDGKHALVTYDAATCQHAPLSHSAAKNLAAAIKHVLGLPTPNGRNPTIWSIAVSTVLGKITPSALPSRTVIDVRPEILAPASVRFVQDPDISKQYRFINTGVSVRGIATIDDDTGVVDRDASVGGEEVLALEWPLGTVNERSRADWQFTLPARVDPVLPSDLLHVYLKNLNTLGHPKGFDALFNAIIVSGLDREQLAGSEMGAALRKEFPLIIAYPMGATLEETTNQGKTNFCRIMCGVFAPGLPRETSMIDQDGAPAMRMLTDDIGTYGTMIIDEYQIPASKRHIFAPGRLQSVACGGGIAPGKAGGNGETLFLKYPLFLTMKISAMPPDMRNRQFGAFFDTITDATRLSDDQMNMITSGRLSMHMRLSALRWMKKTHAHEAMMNMTQMSHKEFRFPAILALATKFAPLEEILAYLAAVGKQCDAQYKESDATGLADELGVTNAFELKYFWEQADRVTIGAIESNMSLAGKSLGVPFGDVLRLLVENGGRRKFDSAIKQYNLRERVAVKLASDQLKKTPMTREGYTLRMLSAEELAQVSEVDRKRSLCRLIKDSGPPVAPDPAAPAAAATPAATPAKG